MGAMARHGWHQAAQKSTSVGVLLLTTSPSNVSSVSSCTFALAMAFSLNTEVPGTQGALLLPSAYAADLSRILGGTCASSRSETKVSPTLIALFVLYTLSCIFYLGFLIAPRDRFAR